MADDQPVQLTEDQIRSSLRETLRQAADWHERGASGLLFPASAQSSRNAADDDMTAPYSFTHGVQALVVSAAEHLGAIAALTDDLDALPAAPFFTLARTGLETACTAYWLLRPSERKVRMTRHIRHEMQDRFDAAQVSRAMIEVVGGEDEDVRLREQYIAQLEKSLRLKNVPRFKHEEVLRGVDAALGAKSANRSPRTFLWKIASGFAHGRPWARRYVFKRGAVEQVSADVVRVHFENTPDRALWALGTILEVLDSTMILYEQASKTSE